MALTAHIFPSFLFFSFTQFLGTHFLLRKDMEGIHTGVKRALELAAGEDVEARAHKKQSVNEEMTTLRLAFDDHGARLQQSKSLRANGEIESAVDLGPPNPQPHSSKAAKEPRMSFLPSMKYA
jgi:hypothetical protein